MTTPSSPSQLLSPCGQALSMSAMDREARLRRDALIGSQPAVGVGYISRSAERPGNDNAAGCEPHDQNGYRGADDDRFTTAYKV